MARPVPKYFWILKVHDDGTTVKTNYGYFSREEAERLAKRFNSELTEGATIHYEVSKDAS